MFDCLCLFEKLDNYVHRRAYTVSEFKCKQLHAMRKKSTDIYIDHPITFDIETSTFKHPMQQDGKDVYEGYMYQWQACIEGIVVMGKRWNEAIELFEYLKEVYELDKKRKLVCYIHNLSYEFHFMYSFFNFTKTFCTDVHKILKATIDDCIECRCSYLLSNRSLEKFIKNTPGAKYLKAKGDLDYDKLFTPEDVLNEKELGYCYNDVAGLYECVMFLLKKDSLKTIPLTNTGYIRRRARSMMRKNPRNRRLFDKLRLSMDQYTELREAFRGGNTASNEYLTNIILECVDSYDITSSYPFAMISEQYPAGEFMNYDIQTLDELDQYNAKYCTVARYTFINPSVKKGVPIPYIPYAKCNRVLGKIRKDGKRGTALIYNGRILDAEVIEITLTNIDYEIVKKQYNYDEMYINDFMFCRKAMLPLQIRELIMELFFNKTTLKGVEGMEYEYMQDKGQLNSTYGMMVTNILHPDVIFDDGIFTKEEGTEEDLEHYYNSRNSFLAYQWGVWVTAYARRNLQRAIDQVGMDVVYCDTDSVKFINDHTDVFIKINQDIINRCKKLGIKNYVDFNGKRVYLGVYDHDAYYDRFKTLGAKKYAYEAKHKIGITVAGLSKVAGAIELSKHGGLEDFKIGKCFNESGRTTAYYNNQYKHYINIKGVDILTGSNIAIVKTTYTLGISAQMMDLLESIGNFNYNY